MIAITPIIVGQLLNIQQLVGYLRDLIYIQFDMVSTIWIYLDEVFSIS